MTDDIKRPRRLVMRISGPQTASGPGDMLIDDHGRHYREVDQYEVSILRAGTAPRIFTIYPNGTIA